MGKSKKEESLKKDENNNLAKDRIAPYGNTKQSKRRIPNSEQKLGQIGAKLRKIRLERGYSSYESFAWEHDIPRMQYWRMEKGKNFTFVSLIKILDAMDMSLSEFFDEDFD